MLYSKAIGAASLRAARARNAFILLAGALALAGSAYGQLTLAVDVTSNGAQEGYISGDGTNPSLASTRANSTADALRIGDVESGGSDLGTRAILSFQTGVIPANATITAASLFLTRGGGAGAIDVGFEGPPIIEVKTGTFNKQNFEKQDFDDAATATPGGTLLYGTLNGDRVESPLNTEGVAAINKANGPGKGRTQLRLRFYNFTDNDGVSDYIGFYSSKTGLSSRRPVLRVTYTIPAADALVTPGSLDFGDQNISAGATASQQVTIENAGTASLGVTSVVLGGSDANQFQVVGDTGETSLAPGGRRFVDITFDPILPAAAKTATLTVTTSDPNQPTSTVFLLGNALRNSPQLRAVPLTHDFGARAAADGPSAPQAFTLTNIGDADLNITSVSITLGDTSDFAIASDSGEAVLATSASRTVQAAFDPIPPDGPRLSFISIESDDPSEAILDLPITGHSGIPTPSPTPSATPTVSQTPTESLTPSISPTATPTPLPPQILLNPISQAVNAGQNVDFLVLAFGSGQLTYQWMKDNAPIPSQTGTTLSLLSVTAADVATYRCDVTNPWGTTPSGDATLQVFTSAGNSAEFQSATLPPQFYPGQSFYVGFTFKNTSQLSWGLAQGYSMAVKQDASAVFGGATRIGFVDPRQIVPPGISYSFIALVQAPGTPGDYTADIQLIQEGVEFFGPVVPVTVRVIPKPNAAEDWGVYE